MQRSEDSLGEPLFPFTLLKQALVSVILYIQLSWPGSIWEILLSLPCSLPQQCWVNIHTFLYPVSIGGFWHHPCPESLLPAKCLECLTCLGAVSRKLSTLVC